MTIATHLSTSNNQLITHTPGPAVLKPKGLTAMAAPGAFL